MVISHRKKYLYFVVPKCASATLRQSISKYTDIGYPVTNLFQHMPIHQFMKTEYADLMDAYFKFTFVRNPYDRLYSGYLQDRLASEKFPDWEKVKKPIFDILGDDYGRYLREYVQHSDIRNDWEWICFCPMYEFAHLDREYRLDWFGKVENFDRDIAQLSKLIGFKIKKVKNWNVNLAPSAQLKYLDKYDRSSVKIVNELYRDDFEFFGYEMLDPNDFPNADESE